MFVILPWWLVAWLFPSCTEYQSNEAGVNKAQSNKIVLSFHLYGLENSDKIISVRVVFKQLINSTLPRFQATVYELKDNGILTKLDSTTSDSSWVDLEVKDIFKPHKKETTNLKGSGSNINSNSEAPINAEHLVVLELTDVNSAQASKDVTALLSSINPFIAVYTYDAQVYEHLSGKTATTTTNDRDDKETTHSAHTVSKRETVTNQEDTTVRSGSESQSQQRLSDMSKHLCQVYGINTTIEELDFLGSNYEVIRPLTVNFTFCYGRCDKPRQANNEPKYTSHARILNILKPDLAAAGAAPCCVPSLEPEDTSSIQIIFLSGNVTLTTTIPSIKSCICQWLFYHFMVFCIINH